VAFSPDGQTLASPGWVFSPDGRTLATASLDGAVRLWILNAGYAIRHICDVVGEQLTPQHWDQYVSAQLPYRPPC
jgi:WD40 repeat protein